MVDVQLPLRIEAFHLLELVFEANRVSLGVQTKDLFKTIRYGLFDRSAGLRNVAASVRSLSLLYRYKKMCLA